MSATTTIERPAKAAEKQQLQQRSVASKSGERHWRSVAKAVSWRAVGTIDTMVVSYLVTRKISVAVSIGSVELFTKIALFYFHERAWQRIPYGRVENSPEQ